LERLEREKEVLMTEVGIGPDKEVEALYEAE
jgi:hypothetical protein